MLAEITRKIKLWAAVAVLGVAVILVYEVDDRTDKARHITVTVTWMQHPDRRPPGHIDVMGQIGRNPPFFGEATDDNPFIESGIAFSGEHVQVKAWAVDGPFAAFSCAIAGPIQVNPPRVWDGLQVLCSGTVR